MSYTIIDYPSFVSNKEKTYQAWFQNNQKEMEVLKEEGVLLYTPRSNWGRVICKWDETVYLKGSSGQTTKKILNHCYTPCFNTKTGELYLDCSPQKTWVKCAIHTLARPGLIVAETLLAIVGIVYEIAMAIIDLTLFKGVFSLRNFLWLEWKHIQDIVRTPLYGVAMMITTLAGVVFSAIVAPFSSQKATEILFFFRKHTGYLNIFLHRGETPSTGRTTLWHGIRYFYEVTFCFKPCNNIMKLYLTDKNFTAHSLQSVAERNIGVWRDRSLLWNGFHKIGKQERFISPVYRKTLPAKFFSAIKTG